MQDSEEIADRSIWVRRILEDAERSAGNAIRTMRSSLASAPPGDVGPLLDDADRLFSLIDAAELRAELARIAADHDEAIEHAEDARSLARAADDEAQRRGRKWG